MKHQFTLERSKKKHKCPECKKKTYVRFVNFKGEYLPEKYGRCDREDKCAYFLSPYHDGFATESFDRDFVYEKYKKVEELPTSYLDNQIMSKTLSGYESNNLFKFLAKKGAAETLFRKYNVGINGDWCIFWNVDKLNRVRSGKYMKYTEQGRRDKSSTMSWEHKRRDIKGDHYPGFVFNQCFFGEHLILENINKPIAIVESEKTALIASMFIDKYIWLACGSKNGLGYSKCEAIKNRSVTLFPDLGAFDLWLEKSREFGYNISDHLEKVATPEQREQGYDLADFLLT